jgi:1-deoxy-D-xylulose-5-phosphate reductoisomerase
MTIELKKSKKEKIKRKKRLAILGSTGSLGKQSLEVVENFKDKIDIVALSANKNIEELEKQIIKLKPEAVWVTNDKSAKKLKNNLKKLHKKLLANSKKKIEEIKIFSKEDGVKKLFLDVPIDMILNAIVGFNGLIPTILTLEMGINLALANKESLVLAGDLVMGIKKIKGVEIIPVDSEHSAIFQCILGRNRKDIDKIILTASGGPFFGKKIDELKDVSVEQAISHPKWKMGKKISIDSATLMNKGFEVIEAYYLFGIEPNKIKVLIHPEAIIHSMVQFKDGSIIAQLGPTDMRIPIQYAITYPEMFESRVEKIDLAKLGKLTFFEPDLNIFPALRLAYLSLELKKKYPTVIAIADEMAVEAYLNKKIKFTDIIKIIEKVVSEYEGCKDPHLEAYFKAINWAKNKTKQVINEILKNI